LTLLRRTIDRDLVMRSKRRHSFPGPAIATARGQLVAIENTGNQFIIGDQDKLFGRRTLLAFATLRFAAVVAVDVTLGPLPHRYPVITLRNKQGWLPGAASLVRRPKWGCGV
jgi:hypothetical protein